MAKWIKASWIKTAPGGGVSLVCFKAYKEERHVNKMTGRITMMRSAKPKDITILVARGDKTLHEESGTMLLAGEFMVQDFQANRDALKRGVVKDFYLMDDWELQNEFAGVEIIPEQLIEVELEQEEMIHVNASHPNSPAAQLETKNKSLENLAKARKAKADAKAKDTKTT